MKPSVLNGIIQRLEVMMQAASIEAEARRFEANGVEACQVLYHPGDDTFELIDSQTEQVYRFDDIDLVAMEIYEMLSALA